MRKASLAMVALIGSGCTAPRSGTPYTPPAAQPSQRVGHAPLEYDAPFAVAAPTMDGRFLDDPAWAKAEWTQPFGDIEGPAKPSPRFDTRVKMCWDELNLYVLAQMSEPDLWATLTAHDEIVFHDHDFEVFIDPDGDTREYYEIEVNVLGTVFDLYLHTPYRAGGPADHAWDAHGMRVAIDARGTVNDPRDRDDGWSVELAIPWECLKPMPGRDGAPTHQRVAMPPAPGDAWHINFSRVEWMLTADGSSYTKVPSRAEDNWTWTPQWEINMHVPQRWGVVRFAKGTS